MPTIQHIHKEDCQWSGGSFVHYLVEAAPDILWYNVQDVGSYQGSVYGVGEYQKQLLLYFHYYGSCSGCGAWGEGGEPENQDAVLENSKLFSDKKKALGYLNKEIKGRYDHPNLPELISAIDEVFENLNSNSK